MNKLFIIPAAILIVIILILSIDAGFGESTGTSYSRSVDTGATSTQVIELRFNTSFPPSHMMYNMGQYFSDQIDKRTSGRVKVSLFPTGALTSTENVYAGVVTGISDIGEFIPAYVSDRFPATDSISVPLSAKNGWVYTHVANDFWQHFQPKEYNDVHVLLVTAGSPYVLQTRISPVLKPQDLRGVKIRASGTMASEYVILLGGIPIALPMFEAYDAANKGAVDAVLGAMDTLKTSRLADVFHYITVLPSPITSAVAYVVNLNRWNALPKDIQGIITDLSKDMVENYAKAWFYMEIDGEEYFLSQNKIRIINEIPPSEASTWDAITEPVIDKYVTGQKAKGLPADDYINFNKERADYWNKNLIDRATCKQWIETNIVKK